MEIKLHINIYNMRFLVTWNIEDTYPHSPTNFMVNRNMDINAESVCENVLSIYSYDSSIDKKHTRVYDTCEETNKLYILVCQETHCDDITNDWYLYIFSNEVELHDKCLDMINSDHDINCQTCKYSGDVYCREMYIKEIKENGSLQYESSDDTYWTLRIIKFDV